MLIGTEAATEKIPLVLIQKESFTPGLTETFSVEAVDVGEVKKIELSNNAYGADSGWFVKEVEVDVPTSGKKYFFPCNRWLSQNKEDGKVVRVLSAADNQLVTYKPRKLFCFLGEYEPSGWCFCAVMTLTIKQTSAAAVKIHNEEEQGYLLIVND